jgi:hypothetical protein
LSKKITMPTTLVIVQLRALELSALVQRRTFSELDFIRKTGMDMLQHLRLPARRELFSERHNNINIPYNSQGGTGLLPQVNAVGTCL